MTEGRGEEEGKRKVMEREGSIDNLLICPDVG